MSTAGNEFALFKSIFDQISDAIYIIDPVTSNIVDVNQAGCDDLGMARAEVLQQSVLSLQKDVKGLPAWRDIVAAIREARTFVFVGRHQRKDGSEFPVEVHTRYFEHAGTEYLVSIARDISERERLQQELQTRLHVHSFALNEAMDGLWDWNVEAGEVYFSPQWMRMMGFGPNEVAPRLETWTDMVHPEDRERVMGRLSAHLEQKTLRYEAEYRLRNRNGDWLWVLDRGKVVERGEGGRPLRVVGMVQDITERKQLEEELRRIAHRDELTGLSNRRAGYEYFGKYLSVAKRRGQPLAVCLIDVDHFKRINDAFGHLAGDRVLQHVTAVFLSQLRESDVLFRWGGEEFLLLLPFTDAPQAHTVAEKLRTALAEAPPAGLPAVTASAGISAYPADGDDIDSLVGRADRALYLAKEQGRDRTVIGA